MVYASKKQVGGIKYTYRRNIIKIKQSCFGDNPSKLYKFYYVRNDVLENGYFAKGSVWIFEIRYEFDADSNGYKFKLFIESADSTSNGVYKNYYKIG